MGERSTTGSAGRGPSLSPPSHRTKVIYVMGAGRSGSTILGVALGNCAGIFYAGELDKWLLMSGVSMAERDQDANPRPEEGTGMWREIREEIADAGPLFGRDTRRCIEHSSALFRVDKWSERKSLRGSYRRLTGALYGSIALHTGASHIVDSSHFPLRARELQERTDVDLHLISLVRDPRSVVASWGRRGLPEPSFPMLTTNAYLWLTHLLSVLVFLRQPRDRRLFVRYERLVADPARVVGEILEMSGSEAALPDFAALSTGTPYHGNRLILSPTVSLNPTASAAPPASLVPRPGTAPPASLLPPSPPFPPNPAAPAPPPASLVTSILQLPWRVVF